MDWLHSIFNTKPWDHRSSGDLKMKIFSVEESSGNFIATNFMFPGRKRNICKILQRSKGFANTLEVTK